MQVLVRFYEELNDFLPPGSRKRDLVRDVEPGITVTQLMEMFSVPEKSVDLILVNGTPADFSRILADGDRLSVYPVFESFDIGRNSPLPGRPLRNPRFIAADHLGKLAKYLRMLGFDTSCQKGGDKRLVHMARQEDRTILSRSSRLMQNRKVTHGYRVRNEMPERQLLEVVRRFDLSGQLRPLSRCLRCNILLEPMDADTVRTRIDSKIYRRHKNFRICPRCCRIYWYGSHAARMVEWIEGLAFSSKEYMAHRFDPPCLPD